MRPRRFLVASASAALFPALVLLLPLGILLASPRLYAESGAAIPRCEAPAIALCEGRAVGADCNETGSTPGKCKDTANCVPLTGDSPRSALTCAAILLCPKDPDPCAAKKEGDVCDSLSSGQPKPGKCKRYSDSCYAKVNGTYALQSTIACEPDVVAPSAGPASDDGGCSTSPAAPVDALALLASPLAFGLLALARRRLRLRRLG